MGKQQNSKQKKPETVGKRKVTPIQIAFIVDRYLCDNNFTETRTTFRNEASSLIANSPIREAPKSLLSLGEMLEEYICLKEQKVMVEQERVFVEQEKNRVQMLLSGMQSVMNIYNDGRSTAVPSKPAQENANSAVVVAAGMQKCSSRTPPTSGVSTTIQNTPTVYSLPQHTNANAENANFSTPVLNATDRKRKNTANIDAPSAAKKSRGKSSNRKIPLQGQNTMPQSDNSVSNQIVARSSSATHLSPGNGLAGGSQAQGSAVAKCLFNQPSLSVPTANSQQSSVPETPIGANSSHTNTHISPPDISSVSTSNVEAAPTCYTIISTKRVMVSPKKQMAYIERTQCISSPVKMDLDKVSKREHVRSRLDFGASNITGNLDNPLPVEISASESVKDADLFDIDFPNLEALGIDFSFTEMLRDLEIPCEGMDFSYHPASSSLTNDNASGSSHECKANQVMSESSTVGDVLSNKEMNMQNTSSAGPNCLNEMKSVTKCTTKLSPVKGRQRSLDKEN